MNKTILAGLDIGTTKVVFLIGVRGPQGLEVIGLGSAKHTGVRQGVVVNIEATIDAIKRARDEAELMAGVSANKVFLGIAGSHISSFDSQGMVAIKDREVDDEDVERVIEAAKAVAIPKDRQVLHVLPSDFRVDGQEGISDPVGMSGVRLESSVHIVTGSKSAIQNTIRCAEGAGLKVAGLVIQQLASAKAILSPDEKDLGACIVDIGGGTCDIIAYREGNVCYTGSIPVGGQNFTHDIAMGLRTTQEAAENLKTKFGSVLKDNADLEATIEVDSVGGRQARQILSRDLCEIIEARAEETLSLIGERLIQENILSNLGSGVILTGGGSQLNGFVEMGDFILDVPVRRGAPLNVGGLTDVVRNPEFSTSVGLLLMALEELKSHPDQKKVARQETGSFSFAGIAKRLKEFIAGN